MNCLVLYIIFVLSGTEPRNRRLHFMGSLYRFRQISDNNAFPYPESITWKTFYQIEGPVFLPKTAIYVLDGKGLTFTFTQSDEDTFWIWVLGFM